MAQRLDIQSLNKAHEKYSETYTVTIGEWELEVDRTFSKSKIGNVIKGMAKANTKFRDKIDPVFSPYVFLLVIKEFTNLEIPNEFEGQIAVMTKLIDLDLFAPIIESIPQKEFDKVLKEIAQFTETINQNMDGLVDSVNKMRIYNDEVEELVDKDIH